MALKLIPPNPPKYKYWYVRGTIAKGRRIFESTGTTRRREAQLVLDGLEKDRLNGKLGRKVQSFEKAATAYIESVKPSVTQCNAIIGAENKDGSLRPCLVTDFAGIDDCREIDQEMVDHIIKKRFKRNKHGRPFKPGTIVRELIQPLTAVLNHASARNYCDEPSFERPSYNDKRDRFGTDLECARILKASAPHAAPIFRFDMFLGDRIGETIDLVIEDVFLDKAWAILRDTKNGTNRGIALHRQIVELLREVIGERTTGAVFLTDLGQPYKTYPKKAWTQACRRAGVVNFRLHDLRPPLAPTPTRPA